MNDKKHTQRVVIALTETSPVADLWEAAMQAMSGPGVEFIALFLHDESWRRAASLPFTREVSLAGGKVSDFTLQRAEQLLNHTAERLRKNIEDLAKRAGQPIAFLVLSEQDQVPAKTLISSETIVVGPSMLAEHPILMELRRADFRIVLIEQGDPERVKEE
jgi:hypothetical protein